MSIRYLHTMIRVSDLDKTLEFFCEGLGLIEVRREAVEKARFTNVFLATPDDVAEAGFTPGSGSLPAGLPALELTFNWDVEPYPDGRNFGHIAYQVDDIYAVCEKLQAMGVTINRPPRDGKMAFVRSPDNISIEILQKDQALPAKEPWASAENIGSW